MFRRLVFLTLLAGGATVASPRPEPLVAGGCEWCETSNWYCLSGVSHLCEGGGTADRYCFDWYERDCDLYALSLESLDAGGGLLEAPRYLMAGEDARRPCDGAVLRFDLDERDRQTIHTAALELTI